MRKKKSNMRGGEAVGSDFQVQGTNDCSSVSKLSMAVAGYVEDEYTKHFIAKPARRSPLINRGYYIRAKAIEYAFQKYFQALNMYSGRIQVLSLGAGFDSTYFRMKGSGTYPSNCVYFEVDFSDVAQRKCQLILGEKELVNKLEDQELFNESLLVLKSRGYKLLGADLRDVTILRSGLLQAEMDFSVPTLLLSECAITYMDEASSSSLIVWLSSQFSHAMFVVYEQIHPEDGFGVVMQHHFCSIGSPLRSVDVFPDAASQARRYLQQGWTSCRVYDMNTFYKTMIPEEEKLRVEALEPFDEYEEWHLKCSHYALIVASEGKFAEGSIFSPASVQKQSVEKNCLSSHVTPVLKFLTCKVGMRRFGHDTVQINSQLVTVGGFAVVKTGHQRTKNISILNLQAGRVTQEVSVSYDRLNFVNSKSAVLDRMHHSLLVLNQQHVLVYGGRTSPKTACEELLSIKPPSAASDDSINDLASAWRVEVVETHGAHPCARWRHSACVVLVDGQQMVFVFGGRTTTKEVLGDSWLLQTSEWTWEELPTDSRVSHRHSHSAVVWEQQKIIIACGLGPKQQPLNDIFCFNVASRCWTELPVTGIIPRYSHRSTICEHKMILLGGVNCTPGLWPGCCVVDLTERTSVEYRLPAQDPEHPVLLHNYSCIFLSEERQLLVIGGGGNCFSFGTLFNDSLLQLELAQFGL